jgi:hypothetical protein
MPSTTRSFKALSATIALAALALDFFASGFTAANIQSALDAAKDPSASAAGVFTVGRVFIASAPIVLAVIVSVLVYEYGRRERWSDSGVWVGVLAVWGCAVLASGWFVNPASAAVANAGATQGAHGPPGVYFAELIGKWIFTAYGGRLAAQGLIVGFVAVVVFAYYTEKWKKEDAAAAAKEAARKSGIPPIATID